MLRVAAVAVIAATTFNLCDGANDFDSQNVMTLIDDILKRLEEKESRITQLENIVFNQQEKIARLEDEVTRQSLLIEEIRKQEIQTDSDHFPGNETSSEKEFKVMVSKESKPQNRIRQAELERPVAFLAALTAHMEHAGANQNIAFDRVITNLGNAYNSHAGAFLAPVSGVYLFSTTLLSFGGTNAHFRVQHNGNAVTLIYQQGSTGPYETASMTVVLQLAKGDDVSITNVDSDITIHGSSYTSFTGVLLQEIYDEQTIVGK